MKRFLANQASRPSGLFGKHIATRIFRKTNRFMEDRIIEHMQPLPEHRLLEIGFGAGRMLEILAKWVYKGKIAGIEISDAMFNKARKSYHQHIVEGLMELHKAGVSSIPYPDNYFDGVSTANTVYFWPYPKSDIQEVMRVLKPGAKFYCGFRPEKQMLDQSVMEQNRDIFQHFFSPEQMQTFLKDAGFEAVNTEYYDDQPMDTVIASARKPV